jgi:succinate-semialdehyde dehydrogenase/glutarate-semialdehyde dehydrogenase
LVKSFKALEPEQIEQKLRLAISAFQTYRQTGFADRARLMLSAAEILEKEKDECARLMTLEMGKTLRSAGAEAAKCATGCRYYAENAERFLADEVVETGAKRSFIRYLPLGPVLAVMPWNFPFWQVFRFAAPALMSGNVGLLKHASNVPQCALKIEEILRRAGFAEGVFQTLLIGSSRLAHCGGDTDRQRAGGHRRWGIRCQANQEGGARTRRQRSVYRYAQRGSGEGGCNGSGSQNSEQRAVLHCRETLHCGRVDCR